MKNMYGTYIYCSMYTKYRSVQFSVYYSTQNTINVTTVLVLNWVFLSSTSLGILHLHITRNCLDQLCPCQEILVTISRISFLRIYSSSTKLMEVVEGNSVMPDAIWQACLSSVLMAFLRLLNWKNSQVPFRKLPILMDFSPTYSMSVA